MEDSIQVRGKTRYFIDYLKALSLLLLRNELFMLGMMVKVRKTRTLSLGETLAVMN